MLSTDKQFGRFLSYVSHEIRSPVSSMMTLCEVLEAGVYGDLNERQKEAAQELQDYGSSLLSLLSNAIDLAKASQGKLTLIPEIIELSSFLQEIDYLTHETLVKKQQVLNKNVDPNITQFIADRNNLKKVVFFMLEQSIINSAPNSTLELDISIQSQHVVFEIKSPSPSFSKIDEKIEGLGLPFAQQITQLLNGEFSYHNVDNVGIFNLSLPWQPTEQAAEKKSDETVLIEYENREKLILIAESEPMQARAVADFLLAQGYRVHSVFNGAEAVQHALNSSPHLIIMASDLPDLDGFAATQQIKSANDTQQIPVLLCSVETDKSYEEKAQQVGAVALLNKPFSLSTLQSFL